MTIKQIEASFIPPHQYLTGYGSPLVHAPDYCEIADVGPVSPPIPRRWDGNLISPLLLCATTGGIEWRDNPSYHGEQEEIRRLNLGLCTHCGKNPKAGPNCEICDDCLPF